MRQNVKFGIGFISLVLCAVMMAVPVFAEGFAADRDLLMERMEEAVKSQEITYATLYDINEVKKADLKVVAKEMLDLNGKVFFRFDTLKEREVQARITVNPILVNEDEGAYNFMVNLESENVTKVNEKFTNSFGRKVAVIGCNEQDFGMYVVISAKVDLTDMDTENLVAYSYNAETNSYAKIPNAGCTVDSTGFVHLQTKRGGFIVLTTAA